MGGWDFTHFGLLFLCVVAGWKLGAKTVLETGEKVKIPWGQQGPGGNKISGKFLRVDEDFFKNFGKM